MPAWSCSETGSEIRVGRGGEGPEIQAQQMRCTHTHGTERKVPDLCLSATQRHGNAGTKFYLPPPRLLSPDCPVCEAAMEKTTIPSRTNASPLYRMPMAGEVFQRHS